MCMSETKKLYAYIDESGQDTNGALFVVGVVVLEEERDTVLKELERIEQESGKRNIKWRKARHRMRETYMRYIAQSPIFKNTLFLKYLAKAKSI